jgi:plastocyanin
MQELRRPWEYHAPRSHGFSSIRLLGIVSWLRAGLRITDGSSFASRRGQKAPMTHSIRTLCIGAVTAAAAGSACTPAPAKTGQATQSPRVAAAPAIEPGIVGTVSYGGNVWTRGATVYLEDAPKQPGVGMTATIDVRHKEFTPFISVITTGGTATFRNGDSNLTHHVFSPDIPNWDTGYLKKNETTATRQFDAPGAYSLLCNIHPEMLGYLLVVPSTSFGIVRPDGHYAIAIANPGTYKATLWAPRTQTQSKSVTVAATGVSSLNFDIPLSAAQ